MLKITSMLFTCLFLILVAACSGPFLSIQSSSPEHVTYCEVLDMPTVSHPAPEPKPYLGIYLATARVEQSVPSSCGGNTFVQAAGVISGSPADKAGLEEADIIVSLDGIPTCGSGEEILPVFRQMIERREIGAVVSMDILRSGRKYSLAARLEGMPLYNHREAEHREIGKCLTQTSAVENALRTQDALPFFDMILDGLYLKSNTVYNPGMTRQEEFLPFQTEEFTYMMRHPFAAGEAAKELSRRITTPLSGSDRQIGEVIENIEGLLDMDLSPSERPSEVSFPALLRTMEETKERVEKAFRNLDPEEKLLLQAKALGPWEDSEWNRILEVSLKVDRRELFAAFSPLLAFLSKDNLSLLKQDLIGRFDHTKGGIVYEAITPIGKVMVGGIGAKIYADDAALILDLGGGNLYLNNAGGTRPGMPVALVINWGGHNHYISSENYSQGAGLLGGGFLIDLGGNALFVSRDGSQGAGFWGIGLLLHGDGGGIFSARKFSQATGQMGIGLLISGRGDDRYSCSYGGQGLGLFGGAGILVDEGGNDMYQLGGLEPDFRDPLRSTVSMGQGFANGVRPERGINGVPGGLGVLIDEEGNDTYIADYFAQGAAYYYGLGILDDRAGDDRYLAGRYAQGAGVHSAIGVLIDRWGDDFYHASFGVAQGTGHDFGIGFFEDSQGDDRYWGGTLVQGAATNGSLGIFIGSDEKDRRVCAGRGQAYAEDETGIGIMIGRGHSPETAPVTVGVKKN
jgi:hypothetical protein